MLWAYCDCMWACWDIQSFFCNSASISWPCGGFTALRLAEMLIWFVRRLYNQHPIQTPSKRPAHNASNVSDMSVGTWKTLTHPNNPNLYKLCNNWIVESEWRLLDQNPVPVESARMNRILRESSWILSIGLFTYIHVFDLNCELEQAVGGHWQLLRVEVCRPHGHVALDACFSLTVRPQTKFINPLSSSSTIFHPLRKINWIIDPCSLHCKDLQPVQGAVVGPHVHYYFISYHCHDVFAAVRLRCFAHLRQDTELASMLSQWSRIQFIRFLMQHFDTPLKQAASCHVSIYQKHRKKHVLASMLKVSGFGQNWKVPG